METRKEVLSSLEQIPGFKALSLRTAPGFDKERRLNNYYKESEGLQIVISIY